MWYLKFDLLPPKVDVGVVSRTVFVYTMSRGLTLTTVCLGQFGVGIAPEPGVQFVPQYLRSFDSSVMNKQILVLIRNELDSDRRDTRFKAPFCVMRSSKTKETDDDEEDHCVILESRPAEDEELGRRDEPLGTAS